MAKHFFTASSLLLALILLALAGCQDDNSLADGTLPPPGFTQHDLAQAPQPPAAQPYPVNPAPQPPRQQTAIRAVPTPRPRMTPLGIIPADWTPPKGVPVRPWQWIIIHHTATSFGNAAIVTRWHIDRGFDEMGYDFLIGNGTNSGDGQIEVGTRWPKQKWGAHTKTPDNRFNETGIGICLVGNFDIAQPTAAQMRSLNKIVAYMMKTYHIPADHVLGHNDCKSTDCPGKNLNVAVVRSAAVRLLADAGDQIAPDTRLASTDELIHDAPK